MQLRAAIALISAAALAYEILLIRIFSIVQWHHFAAMVISLALLGYGCSGTLLALARSWLMRDASERGPSQGRRWRLVFGVSAMLFAVLAVGCLGLAQRVPFNPLALVWDPRQLIGLSALYLLLSLPFLFAATCIGVALMAAGREIPAIYRADLVGAGVGAAGAVAALFVWSASACVRGVAAIAVVAAVAGSLRSRRLGGWGATAVAVAAGSLAFWAVPQPWLQLWMSEYKALAKALLVSGAHAVAERSGPLALLTVVDSPEVPFRHAPGLSLAFSGKLPEQLGVFVDGEAMTTIDRVDSGVGPGGYLDYLSSALPYHLRDRPSVLVIGPGGGQEVWAAWAHAAREIEAVELNPQMSRLLLEEFAGFGGDLYRRSRVALRLAEARSYLRRTESRYDLIQVSLAQSLAASTGGALAASESNLYTVEALVDMLGRLQPDGLLAVTLWLQIPPRANVKLFATAVEALRRLEVGDPRQRLAQIRSWGTVTTLLKKSAFRSEEIAAIRGFCEPRSFDVSYHPEISAAEVNRFNRLQTPYLYEAALAILSDAEGFYDRYKFEVRPATDDRPFFFHFFKWRALSELLGLRGRAGIPLVEWGYLVMVATVAQAVVAGAVLILLPLRLVRGRSRRPGSSRVLAYFAALGLAFLLLEIASIQRLTLYLGHPLYAVAVVLCGFLVFAGLGAGFARRRVRAGERPSIVAPIAAVVGLSTIYLLALPLAQSRTLAMADPARVGLCLLALAPLAFFMGMPFPLGLVRVMEIRPVWVPWAWGINGCASVVGATLAPVVAIHLGFTAVVLFAVVCYLVCAGLACIAPFVPVAGPAT